MIANRIDQEDEDADVREARGTICIDDECGLCRRFVRWLGPGLSRRGYEFVALQEPEIQARLGLPAGQIPDEVKLIAPDGRITGGVDALIAVIAHLDWGWLLAIGARLPGAMPLLRRFYRAIAAHRHCHDDPCPVPRQRRGQAGEGRRWFAGHGRRRLGEGMMASLMLAVVNDLTRHRADGDERGSDRVVGGMDLSGGERPDIMASTATA